MTDLGQEALDEMNRLLLNQKKLKMKLERMGDKQLADLSKMVERLQEQVKDANYLISSLYPFIIGANERKFILELGNYMNKWGAK